MKVSLCDDFQSVAEGDTAIGNSPFSIIKGSFLYDPTI